MEYFPDPGIGKGYMGCLTFDSTGVGGFFTNKRVCEVPLAHIQDHYATGGVLEQRRGGGDQRQCWWPSNTDLGHQYNGKMQGMEQKFLNKLSTNAVP